MKTAEDYTRPPRRVPHYLSPNRKHRSRAITLYQDREKAKAAFLRFLAECGDVARACAMVGRKPKTLNSYREDPEFKAAWDRALEIRHEVLSGQITDLEAESVAVVADSIRQPFDQRLRYTAATKVLTRGGYMKPDQDPQTQRPNVFIGKMVIKRQGTEEVVEERDLIPTESHVVPEDAA